MASAHEIQRTSLPTQAVERILSWLQTGTFAVGDRLPSERQRAREPSISRTSRRQVPAPLGISGITEIMPGGSALVRSAGIKPDLTADTFRRLQQEHAPFQALQARLSFDPQATALAAEHLRPKDPVDVESILSRDAPPLDDGPERAALSPLP